MKKLPMAHETIKFFELNEAYGYGRKVAQYVRRNIRHGRSLIGNHDAGLLVQMVLNARHGNHVEIGTLFGGSAAIVALAKKDFNSRGTITCIDPLDGKMKDRDGAVATAETFWENMEAFGVADMVELVQEKSDPWPVSGRWATGYLDGNHWENLPIRDAMFMRRHCSYAVMIDDYCMGKPEVHDAVIQMCSKQEWIPVHISGLSAIFRRRM